MTNLKPPSNRFERIACRVRQGSALVVVLGFCQLILYGIRVLDSGLGSEYPSVPELGLRKPS